MMKKVTGCQMGCQMGCQNMDKNTPIYVYKMQNI